VTMRLVVMSTATNQRPETGPPCPERTV
jgi:hypothetical protein